MDNSVYIAKLLPYILLLPLFGFLINGLFGKFFSKKIIHTIAIGAVLISFLISVWLTIKLNSIPSKEVTVNLLNWITVGNFNVNFGLLLDPLSSIMIMIITGIGTLIHIYSIGYMHHDESYGRYFTYLNLFVFAMLMLVLGSNMLMMFIGWEGVGLASYLLIGFWFEDNEKASAGKKAFITNRIGDFGFLIGIFGLMFVVGNVDYSSINSAVLSGLITPEIATIIAFMLFIGAMGKSAQIPLYVWLPDAMAGPTPVSALIHAATMVTAGIYMITRLNFLYILSPWVLSIIAIIGVLTALFAASIAIVQTDIKKVLAYSTVSQLGFMFLAVGVGAFGAGMFHLFTHAFFKACLFLGAGAVIHVLHHEQDIRKMGGLHEKLKNISITFLFATIAITGIAPFSGFISKDEILFKAFASENTVIPWLPGVLWIFAVLTAMMTSFYMWRLYYLVFRSGNIRHYDEKIVSHIEKPAKTMSFVLWILGSLSIVVGFIGLPHFIFGNVKIFHLFHHWLEPIIGQSESKVSVINNISLEIGLMGASWVVAMIGWFWARRWYKKELSVHPSIWSNTLAPIHKVLSNKYYVDEFYNFIIRIFIIEFSHKILWKTIDFVIIDGIIIKGLLSWGSYLTGKVLSIFQSGNLQFYVFTMILTFITLFYMIVL